MGNLTDFYLCGHSYGGYLSGTYAARYPQHIKKLLLLSPLGLKTRPENFTLAKMKFSPGAGTWWERALSNSLWGRINMFSLLKMKSTEGIKESLRSYVEGHLRVVDQLESKWLQEHMFQTMLRDNSTSFALFQQFDNGLHAHNPLASPEKLRNKDIPFPISIIYGDYDWMDSRGSRQIVSENLHFASGHA